MSPLSPSVFLLHGNQLRQIKFPSSGRFFQLSHTLIEDEKSIVKIMGIVVFLTSE